MEQLNSVTLRGIIGSVRVQDIQDRKVANFTVATNFAFKGRDGEAIIDNLAQRHSVERRQDSRPGQPSEGPVR